MVKKAKQPNKLLTVKIAPELEARLDRALVKAREKRGDEFLTKSDLVRELLTSGLSKEWES